MSDVQDGALAEVLASAAGRQDPYPHFAVIREAGGTYRSGTGSIVAARYADCQALLKDRSFGHRTLDPLTAIPDPELRERFAARFPRIANKAPSMLELNPPTHTRLRSMVATAFSSGAVRAWRPRVSALVKELLNGLPSQFDLVSEVAVELPALVISDVLGLAREDHYQIVPQVRTIISSVDSALPKADNLRAVYAATDVVEEYFLELIESRRRHPINDLLSQLVTVQHEGQQMSEAELLSTIKLLFVAGYESSTNLIGSGVLALLHHPDAMAALRQDPELTPQAVEEMLRHDAPVQLVGRVALRDTTLGELSVRAGDQVMVLLAAANRDPRVFSEPDAFRFDRREAAPLSFGAGIHYCLGAPLARLEVQLLVAALLARFQHIELVSEQVRYRPNLVLRGVERLDVRAYQDS